MARAHVTTGTEVAEVLKHCGRSAELLEYSKSRLEEQFAKAGVGKEAVVKQTLAQMEVFEVRYARAEQLSEQGLWEGKAPLSFEQANRVVTDEMTLNAMAEAGIERLKFRYAVAENGEFIRAFGIDGKAVTDANQVQKLDDIFHNAFAREHLFLDQQGRMRVADGAQNRAANASEIEQACRSIERNLKGRNISFISQSEAFQAVSSVAQQPSTPAVQSAATATPDASPAEVAPEQSANVSTGPGSQA